MTLSFTVVASKHLIFAFETLLLAIPGRQAHREFAPLTLPEERLEAVDGMIANTKVALPDAAEWLGDYHPLADQLGSAGGLVALGSLTASLRLPPVHDRLSFVRFMRDYQAQILVPRELPAIRAAHGHAERNELRELISLDQRLAQEPMLETFLQPSRRVGQAQLRNLRPLRDHRFVQRFLRAVDSGQAHGWHTLVYGLTLAVYSLPLRQGLLVYAHQTTRGFIYSASGMLCLSEGECRSLLGVFSADLRGPVESLLGQLARPAAVL